MPDETFSFTEYEILEFVQALRESLPGWFTRKSCTREDGHLFFPERNQAWKVAKAKAICRECPVRRQCLEYSFENDFEFGTFGGVSTKERQKFKQEGLSAQGVFDLGE